MKTLDTFKAELLADPATRVAYDALAPEFETARELVAARARAGLTQQQVAERMGTTQSTVARMESGKRPPSLRTVQRYAQAVGARAVLRIPDFESGAFDHSAISPDPVRLVERCWGSVQQRSGSIADPAVRAAAAPARRGRDATPPER